jgi:Fic family protein
LVHEQFETIHPFLDGNGRVGRLLITLYLVSKGILKQPVLYLSDFFERNRTLYYDNLTRVREKNDLLQWFRFFLVGVIETAKSSISTFDNILKLQKQVDRQIQPLGSRTANAQKILHCLYQRPMIDAAKVGQVTGVSPASAYKLIADLEQLGILNEITGGKRGKIYAFTAYLQLFK